MAEILIVEDDPVIAELHKRILIRMGHRVMGIVDSEQEIGKHLHSSPVILMDITLQGKAAGIPLCDKIKAAYPEVKVVFLSAYPPQAFSSELQGIRYDGYLDKMEFREEIGNVLAGIQHPL